MEIRFITWFVEQNKWVDGWDYSNDFQMEKRENTIIFGYSTLMSKVGQYVEDGACVWK